MCIRVLVSKYNIEYTKTVLKCELQNSVFIKPIKNVSF